MGFDHHIEHFVLINMTTESSKPLTSGAEVLLPRTAAAVVANAMSEAVDNRQWAKVPKNPANIILSGQNDK